MAVYRLCQEQLRNASQHLATKNATDPEVFRINRFITWLGVNQLPPATQNKTQLRPISKEKTNFRCFAGNLDVHLMNALKVWPMFTR